MCHRHPWPEQVLTRDEGGARAAVTGTQPTALMAIDAGRIRAPQLETQARLNALEGCARRQHAVQIDLGTRLDQCPVRGWRGRTSARNGE